MTLRNHHEDLSESKPIKEQKWHIQPTEALYQVPGKCRTSPARGHSSKGDADTDGPTMGNMGM